MAKYKISFVIAATVMQQRQKNHDLSPNMACYREAFPIFPRSTSLFFRSFYLILKISYCFQREAVEFLPFLDFPVREGRHPPPPPPPLFFPFRLGNYFLLFPAAAAAAPLRKNSFIKKKTELLPPDYFFRLWRSNFSRKYFNVFHFLQM